MSQAETFLIDLALILVVAGITTIIFRILKQPLVLGYVVAGLLTGPYFSYVHTVENIESVEFWGQIGVVFLLFGLGLEFSFKKMLKMGGIGLVTVLCELTVMFSLGYLLGSYFGWNQITSIFLGCMLTISSTSIILKTFEEKKLGKHKFAGIVFGVLVFEDLLAILLLVFLTTYASSKQLDTSAVVTQAIYLSLFLLFWFSVGIYLLPTLLRRLKKWLSDEIILIVSMGLCFGLVVLSGRLGFSAALGAFVIGSILAETDQHERIIHLTNPLKNFFGAIFFVSIGMMVDPTLLIKYWKYILLLSLLVLLFKPISATIGLLFSGQTLKNSIQASMSLCQIGEFSFIIATLGLTHNVIPADIFPIIVSVSIVTTFFTPYMIKAGNATFHIVYDYAPPSWQTVFDKLGTGQKTLNRAGEWKDLIKSYLSRVFIYGGWCILIIYLIIRFVESFVFEAIHDATWAKASLFAVSMISIAPFLYALIFRRNDTLFNKIWNDSRFSRGPLVALRISKWIVLILIIAFLINRYIGQVFSLGLIAIATLSVLIYFSNFIKRYYLKLEQNFLHNLHNKQTHRASALTEKLPSELHIEYIEVAVGAFIGGKTIREVHHEKHTGVTFIGVERNCCFIDLPEKTELILPGDKVIVIGDDEQINAFRSLCEEAQCSSKEQFSASSDIELFEFVLEEGSPLNGKIANVSSIKQDTGLILIGIQKNDKPGLLRPHTSMTLETGDSLWLVGKKVDAVRIH